MVQWIMLKKLIHQAYDSKCHAVKFQKRDPDVCVPENQKVCS